MKTTKNEVLQILAQMIIDTRLKPMINKATSMDRPGIKVNKALYETDYMEYIAKRNNKLISIEGRLGN